MTYLIRLATKPVKYGTAERLEVSFTAEHRPVEDLGFAMVVEQSGVDRSKVDVNYRKDDTRRADGTAGMYPSHDRFRLLDRHQHLRVLTDRDEHELAQLDVEMEAVKRQLAELRRRRADHVVAAWRRGIKIPIGDLELPARAAEERRLARQAAS